MAKALTMRLPEIVSCMILTNCAKCSWALVEVLRSRRPICEAGSNTSGSTTRQPIVRVGSCCSNTNSNASVVKSCRIRSARKCEQADWILSMSLTREEINSPVCLVWKKAGDWPSTTPYISFRMSRTAE